MDVNKRQCNRGFTLAEVTVSVMVATLLLSLMIPAAMRMVDKAKNDKALTDLEEIQERITTFYRANYRYPLSLMEIYVSAPIDPWGNPYQYLNIADAPNNGMGEEKGEGKGEGEGEGGSYKGKARKYKMQTRINTDYDLYSMGADGKSAPPLTATSSHDDIIRAKNGRFLGSASEYR
jgi:general secretion pathway protein G